MSKASKWLVLLLVFALSFGVLGLVGCAADDEEADEDATEDTAEDTTEDAVELAEGFYAIEYDGTTYEVRLINEGKVIVGSDTAYPPFELINEDGEAEGFDVDLVAAICNEVGLESEFLSYNFDNLIIGVQTASDFDFIASAMTIRADRDEEIDFTDPYFNAGQSLAVADDSDVEALEDLVDSKIGVQSGTTGEAYANDNLPDGSTVVPFENILQAFQALQNGDVQGVVNDKPVTEAVVADAARGLMIVGPTLSEEQYGFGVSEENPGLTALLSAGLQAVRDSGEYDEIITLWFASE